MKMTMYGGAAVLAVGLFGVRTQSQQGARVPLESQEFGTSPVVPCRWALESSAPSVTMSIHEEADEARGDARGVCEVEDIGSLPEGVR